MELDFERDILAVEKRIGELARLNREPNRRFDAEIAELRRNLESVTAEVYARLTPWQTVQVARHPDRPTFGDYAVGIFREFIELHGDRFFGDDPAMRGGFATIEGRRVMLIGTDKGKSVEEKVARNFGMANPEGYRKAARLMRLAEAFGLPVVCLIDTPAAYPGKEAEERGQAEAIARNLLAMARLTAPVIVVVTGEGGSGGAIGIGVGDVVLMLSCAVYSVIPPEGCAAILWRDAAKAAEAAAALRLTAPSLLELGIIDEIIPEPPGGAHRHAEAVGQALKEALLRHLERLDKMSIRKLLDNRYEKYVKIGKYDARKYARH